MKKLFLIAILFSSQWLSAGPDDAVYCVMGHGGYAGYKIKQLYDAGFYYVTGLGCELNARLGLLDAAKMEENVPGYPSQFWTYGTHFNFEGVGINAYNNAGYDPMFSLVLRPHKFTRDEYPAFLREEEGATTPLLSNWGRYLGPFVRSEMEVVGANKLNIGVINSVGAMRALQQTWLASMNKAVQLVMSCENCTSVSLIFSYQMSETFFYSSLYAYASHTDYKSEKESLDYKILVLKENISDGDKVKLPSGRELIVPEGYINDLKTMYPFNYEKNLRSDGSIKFTPLMCDAGIDLKSIPAVIEGAYIETTYTITKTSAIAIMQSGCSDFFFTQLP